MSLVQKLAGRGTLLAVVSSSPADLLEDICRRTGLLSFFPVRISADDVRAPKPAPDAYRLALERLGITARQAIAIEDTRAGLEAALQAGLPAIILRHEYNVRQDYPEAVGVFERPLDADRVVQVIDHFKYPGGDEISGDGLWKRQKSSSNM
jgi:beta-phosphoglucomutase-like phosphatase (HAD superfamily)